MARKPGTKGLESRLAGVEKGIRTLHANNAVIIKELQDGFTSMESRLDQIFNHVDGFIKLHETLDIEFKVVKEQMRRLEERVDHLEANARS